MAGILDYYKEHPELWEENESLLKKDPAYNLGLMDLTRTNFASSVGPEKKGLNKFFSYTLPNLFGGDASLTGPTRSAIADWSPRTGNTTLRTGPFTEDDVPTFFGKNEDKPLYNVDKARIMAHENRHSLTNTYPELFDAQPSWSSLDPEKDNSWWAGITPSKSAHWRQEAFNRYLDSLDYPAIPFRTKTSGVNPVGLSGINRIGGIRPTDAYFDKIWRDKWKPHATKYNNILKKIATSPRNVPGTPIMPMDRGRDEPTRQASYASYDRPGATGSPGYHWKDGGLATMFQRR